MIVTTGDAGGKYTRKHGARMSSIVNELSYEANCRFSLIELGYTYMFLRQVEGNSLFNLGQLCFSRLRSSFLGVIDRVHLHQNSQDATERNHEVVSTATTVSRCLARLLGSRV